MSDRLTESELAELKTCVNLGGFLSHTVARRIIELESTLTTSLAAVTTERDAMAKVVEAARSFLNALELDCLNGESILLGDALSALKPPPAPAVAAPLVEELRKGEGA